MPNSQPKFLFDTADENYIRSTWDFLKTHAGFDGSELTGITTNPNALSKISCNDAETFNKVIPALCRAVTEIRGGQKGGVVFAQFPQMTMSEQAMRKFVSHIISLSDGVTKVGLKIPPYTRVLALVPEFNKLVDTNVTGLADCATALKCVSYGVRYISIINGRMEEQGINARAQVRYIKQGNLGKCEIITASMRTIEGLAWVVEENTLPTIGSRVFDQILAKGLQGAKDFRAMWSKVVDSPPEFNQPEEFALEVTPVMTKLSLDFFQQMDSLGQPLLNSLESAGIL